MVKSTQQIIYFLTYEYTIPLAYEGGGSEQHKIDLFIFNKTSCYIISKIISISKLTNSQRKNDFHSIPD